VSTAGRSRDERRSLRLGRNPPRGQTCCGRARVGRREPRRKPGAVQGIVAVVAKPGSPHGSGLGVFRCVVERNLAWLHRFRRLALRYERRADVHEAFLTCASSPGAT